jgi:hypothetical protein
VSGASHRTSILQFIAIEMDKGKGHTRRRVEKAARGEHRKRVRPTTTNVLQDWYARNH